MILEFIIPTYNRMNNLSGMLFSLINQNNKNWIANVVIDNEHLQMYDDIITSFQKEDRIRY